ncbi:HlyD family efflux transporter periplasmic adaptor subunit [Alkanindiges sp. WGS2144]|uniref:HlyD family efflux transporter periplasmic adaptor subunit n=1 Tax=Alkanindiges sp. WGS2144 TaxID=3366808 RepID=UPI003750C60E
MKTKTKTRYRRLPVALVLVVIITVLLLSYWYLFMRVTVSTNNAYVNGNIIPVQALVDGVVVKINADNSMAVQAGQPLVEQEQNLIHQQLENSKSALAQAVRQTRGQFADVEQIKANIAMLSAQRSKLQVNMNRYKQLRSSGAVSQQELSDAQADIQILDQQIAASQASLKKVNALVAKTSLKNNPLVAQQKANVIANYIQLKRSTILSPASGYVANRKVQAGQQVSAGQLMMNIIPLEDLWITANIKENHMSRIRTGQPVKVTAHIYGNDVEYQGEVIGVEAAGGSTFSMFPPDTTTGNYIHIVERVPVRISLNAAELKNYPLRPGMSVTVNIDTSQFEQLPLLQSKVSVASPSYATDIYQKEVNKAIQLAEQIIQDNQ